MKAVCEALGVSRSNLAASLKAPIAKPLKRVGRAPKPDDELVSAIKAIIGAQPTLSSPRLGDAQAQGCDGGLFTGQRQERVPASAGGDEGFAGCCFGVAAGGVDARRHDGKIAVERSNLRWCSDGLRTGLRQWRENSCRLCSRLL